MRREDNFLKLYEAAQSNAENLLAEAEILFENGRYARAYAIAFTALEEVSKSQLAADVYTGFIEEQEFWECYRDHKKKIREMAWASEDAKHYLDAEEEMYIEVREPTFVERSDALYVRLDGNRVQSPSERITRADAKSIIHTVRVAFHRIMEITEYYGHQIGTKGFMK